MVIKTRTLQKRRGSDTHCTLRVSEPAVEQNERNFSLFMAGCGNDVLLTAPAEQSHRPANSVWRLPGPCNETPVKSCEKNVKLLGCHRAPHPFATALLVIDTMSSSTHAYRFGRFEIRPTERAIFIDGHATALGARAFDLLLTLIEHRDRVVSGKELMDAIWPGLVVEENNLRQQVSALRKILSPQVIITIPARGYRFGIALEGEATSVNGSAGLEPATHLPHDPAHPMAEGRPTIAVLPFVNMSGDPGQEYFSDGITQDIVTRLSKYHWLNVVARNTTLAYKGLTIDVRRTARDLRAHYVVAGSVRRAGTRIRVTAELIDAGTGDHKWAEQYDRELEDIFVVQDEITENVVAQLEPQIGLAERQKVARTEPTDLKAWDCYHLGVAHFFKFTAQNNLEAQRLFQKSREMDPAFGEAQAWWAYATILGMIYWDTEPARDLLDAALAATERALELDDQNAVFYMLKARVQLARREYDSALIGNEMAVSLNPTLAAAHCGLGDTLAYLGRYEEARVRFEKALELSPRDPQLWAFLTYGALAMIFKHDFETAVKWTNKASEIPNHQYWTAAHKAVALGYLGRREEARACAAQLAVENQGFTRAFAERKLFYLKQPVHLQMYLDGLTMAGVR